jgi:hypothetical protein
MATLAELVADVKRLSSQLSDTRAREFVIKAYEKFINIRNWQFLQKFYYLQTVPSKSGNANITSDSNYVICSFSVTSDDVGKYLYVADLQPIRISEVFPETSAIMLEFPLPITTGTYNVIIRKLIYNLPSDCERVLAIVTQTRRIEKRPYNVIDYLDPKKSYVGSIPYYYSEVSPQQIIFYPIPDSIMVLTICYRQIITMPSNDADIIQYYPHIVSIAAKIEACHHLYAYTGDVTWTNLSGQLNEQLTAFLSEAFREDKKHKESYPSVMGPLDTLNPHNIDYIKWMRYWHWT